MFRLNLRRLIALGAAVTVVSAGALVRPPAAIGSDHQDSPLTVSRPGTDLSDVFVFPAPNPQNVVLVMDIHPLIPRGQFQGIGLDPGVMYQFKIDTSGDYREDKVIQLRADGTGTNQSLRVYGPEKPEYPGTQSDWAGDPRYLSFNRVRKFSDGTRVFVGPRKDPFYFDLTQFFKIIPDRDYKNHPGVPGATAACFRKNGKDFLRNFDVLSFVIELPRAQLAGPNGKLGVIHVYATTSLYKNGRWQQVERLGRPAVKEATESFAMHDQSNRSTPWNDMALHRSIYRFMRYTAHRSEKLSKAVTDTLVPDELAADLADNGPARYLAVETRGKSALPTGVVRLVPTIPLGGLKKGIGDPYRKFGGRDLSSPVMDISLGVIFGTLGQKVGLAPNDGQETPCLTSDHVTAGTRGITKDFPYVGAPI